MNDSARLQLIESLAFDHRSSIVRYMEEQATKFELTGQRDAATALRATASSVAAQLDIVAGKQGIASAVTAIIYEAVAAFGQCSFAEVVGSGRGSKATQRTRWAALWVAKKRLGWTDEQLSRDFNRDPSTISHGLQRAEQVRNGDNNFRRITDNLLATELRCENCQYSFIRS